MIKGKAIVSFLLFFSGLAFMYVPAAYGQKEKANPTTFECLAGQKMVAVAFDYSNMSVGRYKLEETFLDKKQAEYNARSEGSGDEWRKEWLGDREKYFEPAFREGFLEMMFWKGVEMSVDEQSEYTLIAHTTFTEPGGPVMWTKETAIDMEIHLVKTDNPDSVLDNIYLKFIRGVAEEGYNMHTSYRLEGAYYVAGKKTAKFIWKNYLK